MPTPYALSSDLVSAWPAKSLEVATYLDTALAAKTDTAMVQNAQTGTSYSYALADASKLLSMSNAASNTVLVTKQATVTWVTGTQLRVINLGAGVTTLVADTGVTINGNVSLKQYQGGTLIRTASDVWLFVPTASSSGMDLMTPTSVAGSGVTLSGGQVSFSAATAVSVNGCFTSTYDNYVIRAQVTTMSLSQYTQMRLRAAGTDNSSSNYYFNGYSVNSSSATGVSVSRSIGLVTSFEVIQTSTDDTFANINVSGPMQAFLTTVQWNTTMVNATDMQHNNAGGRMSVTTAYDGFSFIPSAGALTGTLRVYGMRNS